MVNGLGVLGWGVGGIEAEAAMLGQPVSMLIPEVVGFRLTGKLKEGITATDLVLTVTQMLRAKGVVGQFVEFYGPGLDHLPLADRATIANMAPEYGATCGFFPIDDETLRLSALTGRDEDRIALVEAYAKAQGMWRGAGLRRRSSPTRCELDMGDGRAGARRAEAAAGQTPLEHARRAPSTRRSPSYRGIDVSTAAKRDGGRGRRASPSSPAHRRAQTAAVEGEDYTIGDGDVVIAAITSCTNTSNPSVLIAAGLVARKARALGLTRKPWVKTRLAPGSQVVTDYLEAAGLQEDLDAIGFNLVGYGCTTCIGNSGPLADRRSPRRSPTTTWSRPRCCRATATSKAGSPRLPRQLSRLAAAGRRLCARRRREHRHDHASRSARARTARTSS